MLFVSIELDWTTVKVRRHDGLGNAAELDHRSERFWNARNSPLRTECKRNDLFFFEATTSGSTERQRRAHDLQPATARNAIVFEAFSGCSEIAINGLIKAIHVLDIFQVRDADNLLGVFLF